jgi:hypothetical protein
VATKLKAACAGVIDLSKSRVRLPLRSAAAVVADRLQSLPQVGRPSAKMDLDATAAQILSALHSGAQLTRRQLRESPWCLWATSPALAKDEAALVTLLREWEASGKPRLFRSVASAFVENYGLKQAARIPVAAFLQRLAPKWPGAWAELHEKHAIFDLDLGPGQIAREVIASSRSPIDIFRQAGVGEIVAHGGLTEVVVAALLRNLADEHDHDKRLELVVRYAIRGDGKIAFAGQGPELVEALLKPFVNRAADVTQQDRYLKVLLKAFDDPRLRPGNWTNLTYKEIVLGWLTRQSLRQFLDVVDATTVDYDAKRMWKYRRAFWEGAYEFYRRQGFAAEAWVAFGPQGERVARRTFDPSGFARLHTDGKQVHNDHAVLVFKVADCIVADWNHNGKCHVWSPSSRYPTPKLYKTQYGSNEVQIYTGPGHFETNTELSWGHGGSENYSWQRKVADRLASTIGIRMPEVRYRVR